MSLDRTKAPRVHSTGDINLAPESVIALDNGIDLHVVNSGDQPISRFILFWEGGAMDSPAPAVASVAAEAMREETAGLSGERIADIIDFNGARLGTRNADHFTGLELVMLNSKMDAVLPVAREIATGAVFTPRTVEMVAAKAASARAMQLAKVSVRASEAAHAVVQGPSHPASRVSSPEDFMAVTPQLCADCYAGMLRARKHAYLGGALADADIDRVVSFLESLPATDASPICIEPFAPGRPERIKIEVEGAMQAALSMVMPMPGRDNPDYIPLRLTVMALGGYFGSRLMANIREEKGLTYGIGAALLGSREGAYMEINAQADAAYVEQVIAETVAEIKALRTDPPRGRELERLKLHAWTALAAAADNAFGTIDHYITRMLVGTPSDYFARQLEAIAAITPDTIVRMASTYIDPEALTVAVAGA